jgi:sulfur-oxidizing protein SoxA
MKSALIAACVLSLSWATGTSASPEEDRAAFVRLFQERFPGIALGEYVNGALMLSRDAKAQFDSIMEFPPFQGDIDRGKKLWETPFANGKSFAGCFPNGARNIAGSYPYYDETTDKVVTFEAAINQCLRRNGETEYAYASRETMGVLTAYVRALSDRMPMNIRVDTPAALAKYKEGKRLYFTRMGQYNFACASCHLTYAGKILRTEILSPAVGQAAHFPVFRAGEYLHTLHMRYQRCMEAMRAVPFPAGSEDLNNLEYFHSYLSNGLPLRASVYRK